MIGIVVVSHSAALAHAAVDLALQMGGDAPPTIEIAAGTADGGFGTDAVEIAGAIDRAAGTEGVLVVMDLGSAVLSAEMALEFRSTDAPIVLSAGPFVEGLIAAVVLAAAGADLDTIAAEARGALAAKRDQLGGDPTGPPEPEPVSQPAGAASALYFDAVIDNPSGLHARPAALFVKAASRHDADVQLTDLDRADRNSADRNSADRNRADQDSAGRDSGAASVSGRSLIALMALGVRPGTRVRVSASGPEAAAAIDELRALVDDGFGER